MGYAHDRFRERQTYNQGTLMRTNIFVILCFSLPALAVADDLFITVEEVEISRPFAVAQAGGEKFKDEAFAYFQEGNERETLNMGKPFCVVVVNFDASTERVLPRTLTVISRDTGGRPGIKTGRRAANLYFEDTQVKRVMCTNALKGADELPSKELMREVLGSYLSLR